MLRLLVTLEAFAAGKEREASSLIARDLEAAGCRARVIPDYEKPVRRLIIEAEGPRERILRTLRRAPEVSRIIVIYRERLPNELGRIAREAVDAVREAIGGRRGLSFRVDAKRMGEVEVPFTSMDIAREVGAAIKGSLGLRVDLENPDIVVYVQAGRHGALIGVTPADVYEKRKKSLPPSLFEDLIIVFEEPRMKAELMDMIRLCASLGVELRVVGSHELVRSALEAIGGGPAAKVKLEVFSSVEEAIEGALAIGLTRHAELNEADLLEIIEREQPRRIALLVGNEYEGLSLRARRLAKYLVRLGPELGFSMRSSVAAAYAIGVIVSRRLPATR